MPIFRNLLDNALELAGQDSGDTFETILKAAMNRSYRRCLAAAQSDEERREFTLTLESGTSQYGMPMAVRDVLNFEDAANERSLEIISASEFDNGFPGDTTAGDPRRAYLLGRYGVQKQPSAASIITLVSSNGTDTSKDVRLSGFVSGVLTAETITLSGNTPVNSTNSYTTVERVTKGATFAGNITLTDASANTLAVVPVWSESPTYLWYEFTPIPDAADTLTVRAIMRKPDLVNDYDWPEIEEDYHYLLEWGALAEVLPIVGHSQRGQVYRRDFMEDLRKLSGESGSKQARIRVFADITSYPSDALRRPRIPGVDY